MRFATLLMINDIGNDIFDRYASIYFFCQKKRISPGWRGGREICLMLFWRSTRLAMRLTTDCGTKVPSIAWINGSRLLFLPLNFSTSDEVTQNSLKRPFFSILVSLLGRYANNQNGNLRWYLPLSVDPPPPLMAEISRHFLPHFFSFAIEAYIYETDFTLKKYHF